MKVSLITAVYNRQSTISRALDGVFSQNYKNIESVVVDGASHDSTFKIVSDYKKKHENIVAISEPDSGIYDALNKGIRISSGEILGFAHSDDFFADCSVIKDVVEAFNDKSIDIVYGDLDYVSKDDQDKILRHWVAGNFFPHSLSKGWMPPHPAMFVRRRVVEKLGSFDTGFKISSDYDVILRYFHCTKIHTKYIPRVLVKMQVGGESNRSFVKIFQKSCEDYLILRKNKVGGFWSLFLKNARKIPQFFRLH